jgi:hypothetical protein
MEKGKSINPYKAAMAVIFAICITLMSMFLSVSVSWFLLYLDYKGPYSNLDDKFINLNIN